VRPSGARGPTADPERFEDGYWWQWGELVVVTVIGRLSVLPVAVLGWVMLGGAHGRGIAGAQPLLGFGTLLWAWSALALVGPAALASHRIWSLRRRLAVTVPIGLAWFALGRFVLPAPEAAWPLW
jgi:hypothetical protein